MVLTDLTAICQKLTESSILSEELRLRAGHFVKEFNRLVPVRGKGNSYQHFEGEELLTKISRFLPRVLEVGARPGVLPHD